MRLLFLLKTNSKDLFFLHLRMLFLPLQTIFQMGFLQSITFTMCWNKSKNAVFGHLIYLISPLELAFEEAPTHMAMKGREKWDLRFFSRLIWEIKNHFNIIKWLGIHFKHTLHFPKRRVAWVIVFLSITHEKNILFIKRILPTYSLIKFRFVESDRVWCWELES